ncbi:acetate/propionate family kinase [Pararhodobacter aggregans]|uniref:Acetate kinase n=1 Tax=Pararhodobacter aggregans TaxID=404875 RepID=A0A2T7URL5_9RHOB|nr:acetate/propionate family kinase [Pararhodobacter aggregans]PTX00413.1 acetate kinase [Pararhodobacter aggregans]PVE47390.1 acetate/propionate family kinase [Pararhodobacter aggregans]
MRILVFNAGSSSLKYGVFDHAQGAARQVLKGGFERFRDGVCDWTVEAGGQREAGQAPHADLAAAVAAVPGVLAARGIAGVEAVGHRIAHGGPDFTGPATLDEATLARIERLTPLAPLHNPANLQAVRLARQVWPDPPQVGVFDTSFHLTNPPRVTTYAVPESWRAAGLRRYGFHGTSHKYVAERAAEALGQPVTALRIISVHLGNGASVCAINLGRSLESSMGLTPLEGLVMGTRSGDVDPGAFGYLHRQLGLTIEEIEAALNRDSGLKGLTGSSDMRDVEDRAAAGDGAAQLAINLYAHRARKYVGAYAAAMGGVDAVIFTGGIGENSPSMRRRICDGLEFMGLRLDFDRNQAVDLTDRAAPQIQAYGSRVAVLVTETAEQLQIAREVAQHLARPAAAPKPIPVAVSGRHVHLAADSLAALFGPGYELTVKKPLRQPGNWAAEERVTLVGPKGRIEHVAILGPLRKRTQIEVSRTDSFALGIDAPVRDSGQLDGTPVIRLIGPYGQIDTDGLIVAARHIHMNPADALAMGLEDGQIVGVNVGQGERSLTFGRTLIRIQPNAFTEMHIDTDEANAAGIGAGWEGEIVALEAHLDPGV